MLGKIYTQNHLLSSLLQKKKKKKEFPMKEVIFYQVTYCTKKNASEHSKVGKGGSGCSSTSDC